MGGFRSYVKQEGGQPPGIYDWLGGLKAGRTFVTNGPLFTEFTVDGTGGIGDSVSVAAPGRTVVLDITVECAYPLKRVDILMNGRLVDALGPRGQIRNRISERSVFHIYESCWVAAVRPTKSGMII